MKIGGRIPWNVIPICETSQIYCLMGRHPMKGGSEYHLTAQLNRLEQWSNITSFLSKTYRDCINMVQKPCQVYSLDMRCTREKSGKETYLLVADIEELEKMDASEIHARRLNAKEVSTPMNGAKFPVADGTVQLSGGDQVLRTSTFIRDRPDRGEEQENLWGESDGSSSTPLHDSSLYDGEARHDFWSISGNITLNPESNCTCREQRHSQFH